MIKIAIIDDEENARNIIKGIITYNFPDFNILLAGSMMQGLNLINEQKPEVVLLDIEMPDGTGLDLLSKINKIDFKIIFITAYEKYAVQAFKFSALDYLLKPISETDLVNSVNRAQQEINLEEMIIKLQLFTENMALPKKDKKIILKTMDAIHIINIKDIIHCEAERNYTTFYLKNNKRITVTKTLKEFEEMLKGFNFFRSHHSHLVNFEEISSYRKKDGGYLIMKNKQNVPVSFSKKEQLIQLMKKYPG